MIDIYKQYKLLYGSIHCALLNPSKSAIGHRLLIHRPEPRISDCVVRLTVNLDIFFTSGTSRVWKKASFYPPVVLDVSIALESYMINILEINHGLHHES